MKKFKFLEHTADMKFQSFGKTLEEAFENAALALQEIMTKGIKVKSRINKKFEVNGKDNERLLYDFLEEFLFLLDSEDFLLSKIKRIKITRIPITNKTEKINKSKAEADEDDNGKAYNYKLTAEVIGDDADNYDFTNNVKAITYNEMFVKEEKSRWVCQVVVDV
ncbi:MAG: archease [Nanoarchaeota archaeon]|nr:archease [Nanoarchaeota archaeon]